MMAFDGTLTIGAIGIILSNVLGIVFYFFRIEKTMGQLGYRIDTFEDTLKSIKVTIDKLNENNTRMLLLEERHANLTQIVATATKDLGDLRRGNGFIRQPSRPNIDGEYDQNARD
jgi:hypothetical protein